MSTKKLGQLGMRLVFCLSIFALCMQSIVIDSEGHSYLDESVLTGDQDEDLTTVPHRSEVQVHSSSQAGRLNELHNF